MYRGFWGRWLVLKRDRWHPIPSTLSLLLYSTVVEFLNKYWSKGSAWPGIDMRFFPWILVFKYWTVGSDLSSSLCPYYVWGGGAFFWPIAVSDICCAILGPQIKYICIKGLKIPPQLTSLWIFHDDILRWSPSFIFLLGGGGIWSIGLLRRIPKQA